MLINEFLKYLKQELNYSACTLVAYNSDLRAWQRFATNDRPDTFQPLDATTSDLRTWIAFLGRSGDSPRTIHRKASALRTFYRFLMKRYGLKANPADRLVLARVPKTLPSVISSAQIETVVAEAPAPDGEFAEIRDYLVLQMFYQTGIRASELCSLKDVDVDTASHQIKVLGKRNKERIVPFGNELADLIEEYRKVRQQGVPNCSPTFFLSDKGLSLKYHQVRRIVHSKLDGRVSSPKRSPHVLRHTFATEMLNGGADLNAVRQLLGHESLETTQIYTHISFSEIKHNYQLAHPRALKKGGPHGSKNPSHPL